MALVQSIPFVDEASQKNHVSANLFAPGFDIFRFVSKKEVLCIAHSLALHEW
jgi:hypothetical protein